MAHVNKKLKDAIGAPAWASFFTPSQYVDFARLITDDLKARGLAWRDDDGNAIIRRGGGPAQRVGLLNLAQMCHMDPAPRWPKTIHEFFDSTLKAESHIEQLVAGLQDLAGVRDKIKLRLHGEDYLQTPGASELLIRKLVPGLVALVVCDMGFANISVPRSMAQDWGLSEDEIYDLGLKNVREREKVIHAHMPPLPDGVRLEGIEGHSNYAATFALCLEAKCPDVSGFGMVLTIPNRHLLFLHRIVDMGFHGAISALHTMTEQAYRDGPGSISREFFWWRPGHGLRRLLVQRAQDQLLFLPDPEYQQEVIQPLMRGN